MERDLMLSRRRFLQSLAAVGIVAACGPAAAPGASPTGTGAKAVSIEWWRRNYTPA